MNSQPLPQSFENRFFLKTVSGSGPMRIIKAVFLTLLFCAAVLTPQSRAQVYTMTDHNSSAKVDVGSQAGMFNWTLEGQSELNQQWFWLGVSNAAPISIDKIGSPTVVTPSNQQVNATYATAGYSVEVDYLLTGWNPGSGVSDMQHTITLQNNSSASMVLHFCQYSDFSLGGNNDNIVQLGKTLRGA